MAGVEERTVLCMRWGGLYSKDYVNILYNSVRRYLSGKFRFVCLTDDTEGLLEGIEALPLPDLGLPAEKLANGGWQKLCVFAPSLYNIEGRVLFLDIDVIITGSLDIFFEKRAPIEIIREWAQLGRRLLGGVSGGNSSVFAFDIGGQTQIYEKFMENQSGAFGSFRNEQRFLCAHAQGLAFWRKGLCLSFKEDLMFYPPLNFLFAPRALPKEARIVAFHGRPHPDEVVRSGRWGKGFRSGKGAVGWALESWRL